jgi:hypothetical protein
VGQSGIKEYYYKQNQVTSLFNEGNIVETIPTILAKTTILEALTVDSLTTPEALLEQIQTMNFSEDKKYLAETAKWLIPLLKSGLVTVKMSDNLPQGVAGHTSRPDLKGQIVIFLSTTEMENLSKDKGAELIIHEVLHSVAVSHLTEYFDNTGKALKSETFIPEHVQALFDAYTVARENYADEVEELEDKIAHNSVKGNPQLSYTERELNVIYGLTNIFEFVSVSMTSEEFQKEFKDVPFNSSKSVFSKIQDFILGMLDTVFPNLKQDSIARQSILASMNFIQEERTKVKGKTEVQPIMPSASVGMVYGKSVKDPSEQKEKVTESPEIAVENLREQEKQEIKEALPNAEYKADGKIDVEKLSVSDQLTYGAIYIKYDRLITPLLKQIEEGESMISNNLTTFDTSIEKLGLSKKEWDSLTQEEQDKIKKCN